MQTKTLWRLSAVAATAAVVAACGGGGSVAQFVTGTPIPLAATTSSGEAFNFVNSQTANGSETNGEPFPLGDAVLATSETAEPAPLT